MGGGTGTPKLLMGWKHRELLQPVVVVANTADDWDFYGINVSPDVDSTLYHLAQIADDRGWGIKNDTFNAMQSLKSLGEEVWFNLGDLDLGHCILRTHFLTQGLKATQITDIFRQNMGIRLKIFPMTDDSVQTIFHSGDNEYHLQEFFVKHRAQIPITSVEYRGAESARVNPELKEVIRKAKLIIIGPSNPVSSIGPILFPEMRRIIQKTSVPKMVISPIIGDKTVSGPAKKYMMELGYDSSPTGIVNYYDDVANVFVFHVTDRNENLARKYPEKRIFFKNILFSDKKDLKNLTLWIDEVAERPNSLELC